MSIQWTHVRRYHRFTDTLQHHTRDVLPPATYSPGIVEGMNPKREKVLIIWRKVRELSESEEGKIAEAREKAHSVFPFGTSLLSGELKGG